ncbi:MAG: FIST C-terminal domain-containing protein [Verrucomicrobia bacterium]|nr:FIST C-terminal domain-containing protein [Verrucomicrobiota bacterium]
MNDQHSVTGFWQGRFDEARLQAWAESLRSRLPASQVALGLVFMTPHYFPHASQVLELLRVHARIPLLLGCSGCSLVVDDQELEDAMGLVVGLYDLPGAVLKPFAFNQSHVEDARSPEDWHRLTGLEPGEVSGWLVFADPFRMDCERWLQHWNAAYDGLPVVGGLASGNPGEHQTQVYLNGQANDEGAVAVAFGGGVDLLSVLSQGCTPIGQTWTITRAERNFIHEIARRPAYQVLLDTYNSLPATDQQKARGNLFVGLVTNEYQEEFHRGDFLIRNLIGADPTSGSLAVGAVPRIGQTIQFQWRDAAASTEDMTALLERARRRVAGRTVYGGCLCCCNGRGQRLFGVPHHDARQIQQQLGPLGLTGFFCSGEIGPVGDHNFLHGYTASLALFVGNHPPPPVPPPATA